MYTVENASVYELITELCEKSATKFCAQSSVSPKRLVAKMRSHAYEIILKRSDKDVKVSYNKAISDMYAYYFVLQANAKNVVEYKKSIELKELLSSLRRMEENNNKQLVNDVIKFLISLKDTVKEDVSSEIFQKPFTFGLFDQMLPRPSKEVFGSPQPYQYYPSYVFELPFSIRNQTSTVAHQQSQSYTEYTVECFDSRSYLPEKSYSQMYGSKNVKKFLSPMSIASLASTQLSPYSQNSALAFPRLTAPRDLLIPGTESNNATNIKVSLANTSVKTDFKEVFRAKSSNGSVDIWEIASQIDKDIPDNIWEIVSKMPPVHERQLIASSSREVNLWRETYGDIMSELNIVSEKQFIRHIMYLTIGIETNSFPFCNEANSFFMKKNLILEGVSRECILGYVASLLLIGTYYRRLYNFAFNQTLEDHFHSNGLIYESTREVMRRYLLEFRLKATEIYDNSCIRDANHLNCMPTLLQILHHIEPLKYEIETIASIYKMTNAESSTFIPYGAELMSYLFNEISLVTHKQTAFTMFNSLYSICKVYFKFIERFIFEGELDDRYHEFFIRKDSHYVNCRSKRYWDKGFHITQSVAVPDFLRALAKCILLCGKSLRLLKLCNPSDPLVVLISSDHPSVKCCVSFEELDQQQQVLDVYRTRCLFVSGEPATFEQILLKREAERKAFTEMASIKQAETMEKIIAERKRLAQLIIAEKQHSLRVLEAAMAEAKAAKYKSKHREKLRTELEQAAERSREEVDAKLINVERGKIMEYYSKLNMEVEKSKIHTEWKIKRLQLDQSRIQLLSTEERNLKREKLELEHKKNDDIMAMSFQDTSEDEIQVHEFVNIDPTNSAAEYDESVQETGSNVIPVKESSEVFSMIYSAARSFFSRPKLVSSETSGICDNQKQLDSQGNVITIDAPEVNANLSKDTPDSDRLVKYDNSEYYKTRVDAINNRQKVMSHNYNTPTVNITSIDDDNNVKMINYDCPFEEAKRNKIKVLGAECEKLNVKNETQISQPRTVEQKQALLNKQKVLGVEYNIESSFVRREPATEAQEEAVHNRNRILRSDYDKDLQMNSRKQSLKRTGLTLNLKPPNENINKGFSGITPTPGGLTPAEFFPRLDLETPTTADVPYDGQFANDLFTPQDTERNDESNTSKRKKHFLSSEGGFNFSTIINDEGVAGDISDLQTLDSSEDSPCKNIDVFKKSLWKSQDDIRRSDEFDPFGLKHIKTFASDILNKDLSLRITKSCYTHPAQIMENVQKKPYSNIFLSQEDKEEDGKKIICDNIATLTACLQRSVMLPLTYQLEVVNNSILTYFLVNLDMYEHLRSLKDYFFLMDGEFSKSICYNLFAKLIKTLNPQELLNFATLHSILDKALGSSISHIHKFSENLSFTINEAPLSFQHSSPDVMQCLSLTYSVNWPLNIILSQEALIRYAKVFQFLVKMRRISWVLGQDFEALKLSVKLFSSDSRRLLRSPQYRSIQIYRHVMASFIRALDNYIVTTCILTSWTEFENDLKKARTLDDLYDYHVVYIKKVLFRCLLNNRSTPVMKLFNDIFTVILKFSRVLKSGEWYQKKSSEQFTHSNFNQLEELFHVFEKIAKYLHKVITRLMECGYQRHLVELLTMINLNGYYDPNKSRDHNIDPNSSIQSN